MAIATIGVLARLAFGFGYWVDRPLTRDETEYLSLARSLAAGRGFVYDAHVLDTGVEPFGRAPGYPAFLALVGGGRDVPTSTPAPVKVAQSIVGGIGVLLIALLAFRTGDGRSAVATAVIASVFPPLAWTSSYVFSEALFWPIGLAVALGISHFLEVQPARSRWPLALALGMLTGVALLIRAGTVIVVPLLCLWLLRKRRLADMFVLFIGLAVVVGPWTVRNVVHHDRFVFIASEGGVTFWTGNNPLATGEGDMAANPDIKRASLDLRARYPALSEEAMEPIYYAEAFDWIADHPGAWLWLTMKKAFYTVVPIGPSYRLHSGLYYGTTLLSLTVVGLLAILGFVRQRRDLSNVSGLWLMVGATVLASLVFFPQERFRIPVIDPALILLAGGAFTRRGDRGLRAAAR